MQKTRKLHLMDFIKLAERLDSDDHQPRRLRIRQPDEEIRLAPWSSIYPNLPGWSQSSQGKGIS